MKILALLACTAVALAMAVGCARTGISSQDAKDAYGPKMSESEMERELKKADPAKYEEYKRIKERDAAVEAQQRAAAGGSQGEVQEGAGER